MAPFVNSPNHRLFSLLTRLMLQIELYRAVAMKYSSSFSELLNDVRKRKCNSLLSLTKEGDGKHDYHSKAS